MGKKDPKRTNRMVTKKASVRAVFFEEVTFRHLPVGPVSI